MNSVVSSTLDFMSEVKNENHGTLRVSIDKYYVTLSSDINTVTLTHEEFKQISVFLHSYENAVNALGVDLVS